METRPRILVIGDIMLDRYISGSVARMSPEAPVPIVKVEKEWSVLGGAGNVAANVAALKATAVLVGLIGNDGPGSELKEKCDEMGIACRFIISKKPTITKTRVVSGQQIVRIDREEPLEWEQGPLAELRLILETEIVNADIVLISDYAKGTLSDEVLKTIMELASSFNKKVLIDPKRADWHMYRGAFMVCPNLKELAMAIGSVNMDNDDNLVVGTCQKLQSQFDLDHVLCTRSSYGMSLISETGLLNIPTKAQEVYDVSGAGDTVLATLGVSLVKGKTVTESAFTANAAAGIVVSKMGTAVVTPMELERFQKDPSKLMEWTEIPTFNAKNGHRKVVFTNGCFDVLHQGHRSLLAKAKALGDVLVVGMNTDASIRKLKGKDRPINTELDRIEAISVLPYVDKIVLFSEDTPFELLKQLKAHVLVKGADYQLGDVVGKELVDEVVLIDLVTGVSTTGFFA